jgi:hypothetical protein
MSNVGGKSLLGFSTKTSNDSPIAAKSSAKRNNRWATASRYRRALCLQSLGTALAFLTGQNE